MLTALHYPIPANWNDFENIIYYIYKAEYPNCIINRYGRQGQNQKGIDIYIQNSTNTVIQCKDFELKNTQEIDDIVNNISFTPRGQIIIATTGKRDTKLQNHIIQNYPKIVDILFWDDIESRISLYNLNYLFFNTKQNTINDDFFKELTEIVTKVCYEFDAYLFNYSLFNIIETKIQEYTMPSDLSLLPYRGILSQIATVLSQIHNIFDPQYYHPTNGDYALCFNQHYENDAILEKKKKEYLKYSKQLLNLYNQFLNSI